MTSYANVAATFMEHLCNCDAHGYSQSERWGNASKGTCYVDCEGVTGEFYKGDRDCSSAVIDAWQEAIKDTSYAGSLSGATYTGNMRNTFVNSGLFEWKPMSFTAQRGDIYLSEGSHTAMCTSAVPDMLAEFSIAETGGITGTSGDQTGRESYIHAYYDYPWDGILHYNGKADGGGSDSASSTSGGVTTELAQRVINGEFGNGDERKQRLTAAGYDYDAVQAKVNELLGASSSSSVDIDALAQAVIRGDYGNGDERKQRLGSNYEAVQKRVNELLS